MEGMHSRSVDEVEGKGVWAIKNERGSVDAVLVQPSEHVGVSEGVDGKVDVMFERVAAGLVSG